MRLTAVEAVCVVCAFVRRSSSCSCGKLSHDVLWSSSEVSQQLSTDRITTRWWMGRCCQRRGHGGGFSTCLQGGAPMAFSQNWWLVLLQYTQSSASSILSSWHLSECAKNLKIWMLYFKKVTTIPGRGLGTTHQNQTPYPAIPLHYKNCLESGLAFVWGIEISDWWCCASDLLACVTLWFQHTVNWSKLCRVHDLIMVIMW